MSESWDWVDDLIIEEAQQEQESSQGTTVFYITFKTPDVVQDVLGTLGDNKQKAEQFVKKYISFGELITIKFDLKAETAVVVNFNK